MRAVPILLVLAATACASRAAQPRFDPATYSALCAPNPDSTTAKAGGCVLKDQGLLRTLPSDVRVGPRIVTQPPQQ